MDAIIIGAGGLGKVVLEIMVKQGDYKIVGFVDDNIKSTDAHGIGVIGTLSDIDSIRDSGVKHAAIAIGHNKNRERVYKQLKNAGYSILTLFHEKSIVSESSIVGEGCLILAGAILNTDSRIGRCCILDTGCTVDHDNKLDDFVHIGPGAHTAGNVSIGKYTHLGIGSTVNQNLVIGRNVIVGAGAAVVKDVSDNLIVAGIPAKKMKENI